MADQTSTVELVFQGIDRTSEATQAALGNAQQFSQSIQSVTGPVADFTKDALKFEAALLAGGAAMTAVSIVAAGNFDEAFREISTLLDEPIESLEEFRQAILDYASSSTQSLPEVTGAVYAAISAGVDYTESLEAVRVAEQLAVAGKAGLRESLIVLVSSLNAYNLSMDEAESFSDALFQAVRDGQLTLDELAGSMARVTGTAATLEVPFEVLLAAISTLTASGMPANQAITAINAALNNLLNPSQQARDVAEDLGIQFDAQAVKALGLEGVLQQVAEATGGNEEQMGKLFGSTQALSAIFPLVGAQADTFAENIENQGNAAGATAEAYEKMADAFSLQNQRIFNSFQQVLIAIGDPLLSEYGNVASSIAAIFNALGMEVKEGELGGIVDVIQGILADAAQALDNVSINLPAAFEIADLTGVENAVQQLIDTIANLFSGFDLSTPEGLAAAIQSLGGAFEVLTQFSASAIESFQWIFDAIARNHQDVVDTGKAFAEIAGTMGGLAIQINAVLPSVDVLFGAMSTLAGVIAVNQTTSLVATIVKLKASASGLALTLGPAGAVAIAAGYLILKIRDVVNAFQDLSEAKERERLANEESAEAQERLIDRYARLSRELGMAITGQEDLYQLQKDGIVTQNEMTGEWEVTTQKVRDYEAEVSQALAEATSESADHSAALRQHAIDAGLGFSEARGAIVAAGSDLDDLAGSAESAGDSVAYISHIAEDGSVIFSDLGQTGVKAFDDIDKKAHDVMETSEEFRIRFREIAAEEYIATIQAQTELDMARLESDTRIVEATFESINTTIMSTGELIGGLIGNLDGATGRARMTIEEQLRSEDRRREQALELQKKLTEAQIDSLRERTRAMQRGQALIEVDGSGLQPHLEAFMWEVLRSIQTRVNEDGLEMLLGMEP